MTAQQHAAAAAAAAAAGEVVAAAAAAAASAVVASEAVEAAAAVSCFFRAHWRREKRGELAARGAAIVLHSPGERARGREEEEGDILKRRVREQRRDIVEGRKRRREMGEKRYMRKGEFGKRGERERKRTPERTLGGAGGGGSGGGKLCDTDTVRALRGAA